METSLKSSNCSAEDIPGTIAIASNADDTIVLLPNGRIPLFDTYSDEEEQRSHSRSNPVPASPHANGTHWHFLDSPQCISGHNHRWNSLDVGELSDLVTIAPAVIAGELSPQRPSSELARHEQNDDADVESIAINERLVTAANEARGICSCFTASERIVFRSSQYAVTFARNNKRRCVGTSACRCRASILRQERNAWSHA